MVKRFSIGIMINGNEFRRIDNVSRKRIGKWLCEQLEQRLGNTNEAVTMLPPHWDIKITQFNIERWQSNGKS